MGGGDNVLTGAAFALNHESQGGILLFLEPRSGVALHRARTDCAGRRRAGPRRCGGRKTMAGMAHGGAAQDNRLNGEVGYELPVGSRT